jgi:hypothetical protein
LLEARPDAGLLGVEQLRRAHQLASIASRARSPSAASTLVGTARTPMRAAHGTPQPHTPVNSRASAAMLASTQRQLCGTRTMAGSGGRHAA